tara:strand:- start:113 stop:301 length:189 start_codon:yes stop_codon:yes gene_type:complete
MQESGFSFKNRNHSTKILSIKSLNHEVKLGLPKHYSNKKIKRFINLSESKYHSSKDFRFIFI